MSLWGTSAADRSKPKFLKVNGRFSPDNVYATTRGWVYKHRNGKTELLVCIRGLSDALGGAQITEVFFDKTVYAQTDTASITVVFTEPVAVTSGSATLSVTTVSGLGGSPLTFTYASGTGTDKLVFTLALTGLADIAGETLALVGQTVGSAVWTDATGTTGTVATAFATGVQVAAADHGSIAFVNPTVSGGTIVAVGFGAAAYAAAAVVTVKVKYNQNVVVTGVPTVSINQVTVGAVNALYASGSGTNTLSFTFNFSGVGVSTKTIQILAQTLGTPGGATLLVGATPAEVTFVSGDRKDSALTGAYADIVLS